jgi:hypothetical protein
MGRKHDTVQHCDDVGQMRGITEEGKRKETTLVEIIRILLGQKIKKIDAVDSTGTNGW